MNLFDVEEQIVFFETKIKEMQTKIRDLEFSNAPSYEELINLKTMKEYYVARANSLKLKKEFVLHQKHKLRMEDNDDESTPYDHDYPGTHVGNS